LASRENSDAMPSSPARPSKASSASTDAAQKAAAAEEVRKLTQSFGELVRSLRLERLMTQAELATHAELDPNYIGMIERAERRVSLYNAWRIAGGLGMTLGEMLEPIARRKPISAGSRAAQTRRKRT
jgi:ribosome-binding protein aMBF1 (putative translation factor)